jgi:hypothetical protein
MSFQNSHEYEVSTMKDSNESFDPLGELYHFTFIKQQYCDKQLKKLNIRDLKYKKCLR